MLQQVNNDSKYEKKRDLDFLFGQDGFINNMYKKKFNNEKELDETIVVNSLDFDNKNIYYMYPNDKKDLFYGRTDSVTGGGTDGENLIRSPLKYKTLEDAIKSKRYDWLWIDISDLPQMEKDKIIKDIDNIKINTIIALGSSLINIKNAKIYRAVCGNYFAFLNFEPIDKIGGSPFIEVSVIDSIMNFVESLL